MNVIDVVNVDYREVEIKYSRLSIDILKNILVKV